MIRFLKILLILFSITVLGTGLISCVFQDQSTRKYITVDSKNQKYEINDSIHFKLVQKNDTTDLHIWEKGEELPEKIFLASDVEAEFQILVISWMDNQIQSAKMLPFTSQGQGKTVDVVFDYFVFKNGAPPTLLQDLDSLVEIDINQSHTFRFEYNGPDPEITWFHNGNKIAGANGVELTLSGKPSESGTYYAELQFTNDYRIQTSNARVTFSGIIISAEVQGDGLVKANGSVPPIILQKGESVSFSFHPVIGDTLVVVEVNGTPNSDAVLNKALTLSNLQESVSIKVVFEPSVYPFKVKANDTLRGTAAGPDSVEYALTYPISANEKEGHFFGGWQILSGAEFISIENATKKQTQITAKGPGEIEAFFEVIGTLSKPLIEPQSARFNDTLAVQISQAVPIEGAQIRYTLDGSDPTQSSLLYENPIILRKDQTIKARAFKDQEFKSSEISQAIFAKNSPPMVITGQPVTLAFENSGKVYFQSNDEDGSVVRFEIRNVLNGQVDTADGVVTGNSGNVTFTPKAGFSGQAGFEVRVRDNDGGWSAWKTISITVDGNNPPVIITSPQEVAGLGNIFSQHFDATDPEGKAITWTLSGSDIPEGMNINSESGLLEWYVDWKKTINIPGKAYREIKVIARDQDGGQDEKEFDITIVNHQWSYEQNVEPPNIDQFKALSNEVLFSIERPGSKILISNDRGKSFSTWFTASWHADEGEVSYTDFQKLFVFPNSVIVHAQIQENSQQGYPVIREQIRSISIPDKTVEMMFRSDTVGSGVSAYGLENLNVLSDKRFLGYLVQDYKGIREDHIVSDKSSVKQIEFLPVLDALLEENGEGIVITEDSLQFYDEKGNKEYITSNLSEVSRLFAFPGEGFIAQIGDEYFKSRYKRIYALSMYALPQLNGFQIKEIVVLNEFIQYALSETGTVYFSSDNWQAERIEQPMKKVDRLFVSADSSTVFTYSNHFKELAY